MIRIWTRFERSLMAAMARSRLLRVAILAYTFVSLLLAAPALALG